MYYMYIYHFPFLQIQSHVSIAQYLGQDCPLLSSHTISGGCERWDTFTVFSGYQHYRIALPSTTGTAHTHIHTLHIHNWSSTQTCVGQSCINEHVYIVYPALKQKFSGTHLAQIPWCIAPHMHRPKVLGLTVTALCIFRNSTMPSSLILCPCKGSRPTTLAKVLKVTE